MSENQEQEGHAGHDDGAHGDDAGHHVKYFKIYVILLVLFAISVAGPAVGEATGLVWLTLVTAFGIAVVKANLVIQNFMHLRWEKRLMKWMLTTSLLLMFLMVAGMSPDIMNHEGNNWENVAAKEATARGLAGGEEAVVEEPVEVVVAGFNAPSMYGLVCATCHGAGGQGDGAAGLALDPRPAAFTDPAFWADRDMDRIVTVIRDGAAAVGGSTLMVPWGPSFSEEEIQALADYVATFRPGA